MELRFHTRLPFGAKLETVSCSSSSKLVLCIKSTTSEGDMGAFSSSGGIMLIACGSSNIAADDGGGPEGAWGWQLLPLEDVCGGGSPPSLLSGRLPEIFGRYS